MNASILQQQHHRNPCFLLSRPDPADDGLTPLTNELRRYVTGWLNYFGISHTYNQVVELAEWVRRRVRLYY